MSLAAATALTMVPRAAQALWGPAFIPRQGVRLRPPDQSWLQDAPAKSGGSAKGKVAVFPFEGDDVYEPMRAEAVRLLRQKGLTVMASLRPVDSTAQLREMSATLGLGAILEGDVRGEGAHQTAHVRVRSGVSGQTIATATFTGSTVQIAAAIKRGLWSRVGSSIRHSCAGSGRPRRLDKEPLRIDAGEPMDNAVAAGGL